MSDNRHFDMTGVGLDMALAVAFGQQKAVAWAERDVPHDERPAAHRRKRLILFWVLPTGLDKVKAGDVHPLPAPMDVEQAKPFVSAWLDAANYGPQPDHDGDNGRGHRVYCEDWGHVDHDYRAFVAIEPAWLIFGK